VAEKKMDPTDEAEQEASLWQRTLETLIRRGASPAEAIDGANLILQAHRRKREETMSRLLAHGSYPPVSGHVAKTPRRRASGESE
jgi:hypothetical protein